MSKKFTLAYQIILVLLALALLYPTFANAATINIEGKAKALNTDNSYLDFSSYNSNVTADTETGVFSGYAFAEDLGWVAFGTVDNPSGPVIYDLLTGAVSGQARIINTDEELNFNSHNSNVVVNLNNGAFSGYVFSTDIGWYNFSDTGVNTANNTLDTDPPDAFRLESPDHQSYINSERPTFRWKTATDQVTSIAKYVLEIDNGDSGDFIVDNIPSSRNTDLVTNKYTIQYEGFNDNNPDNNYISVHTHQSSEWGANENDGKLREGKRIWSVKAYDSNGNDRSESRTLFADFTPSSVNATYKLNGTTPTIAGRITDTLVGDSIPNKVASGPHSVEIKIERKNNLGVYKLHSFATINFADMYWTWDNSKITQRTENFSDKYADFSFTPDRALGAGNYRISITGIDHATNWRVSPFRYITIRGSGSLPTEPTEETFEDSPTEEVPDDIEKTEVVEEITTTSRPSLWSRIGTFFRSVVDKFSQAGRFAIACAEQVFQEKVNLADSILAYLQNVMQATGQMIAGIFKTPSMIAGRIYTWVAYSVGSFNEIVLNKEPTRITDVIVAEIGTDYAIVEWRTNHFTKNNKVNWGETTQYGDHAFAEDFKNEHRVKIEGLNPDTAYKFEVMSQNKNYVYDSFHEFVTKPE